MNFYEFSIFLIKAFFVAVIALSILFGVLLPLIYNLSHQSHQKDIQSPVYRQQRMPVISFEEEEIEIPTTGSDENARKKRILEMALGDTSKTTHLVRNWINENK